MRKSIEFYAENRNSNQSIERRFLLGVAVSMALVVIVASLNPNPDHKKRPEIHIPSAHKVGETTGKTTGDFARGFFSGLWKSSRGK